MYVNTDQWHHAEWSPARAEIDGDVKDIHATSCLFLMVPSDEILGATTLLDRVVKSPLWEMLSRQDLGGEVIEFGELLRRCRAASKQCTTGCGVLIGGAGFDQHRILDIGAALPYEGGEVRWFLANHRADDDCLVLHNTRWRCALMSMDPKQVTDAYIPILPLFSEPGRE